MMSFFTNHNTAYVYCFSSLLIIGSLLSACQAPVVNPNSPTGQVSVPTVSSEPKPATPETRPINKTPKPNVTHLPKTETTSDKHNQKTPEPPVTPSKPTPVVVKPKPVTPKEVLAQQRERQENAKQPEQKQRHTHQQKPARDGSNIPAFNNLMKIAIKQLRANQLNTAQQTFTKAQRLGPQSPAVYMYLSEIAIKKKQGTQAENLARRGLLVSRSKRYDKALWQMVLISAKMRNRSATVQEAEQQLERLK